MSNCESRIGRRFRKFIVPVEILRYDGSYDHTRTFQIKALDEDEAEAIVHNHMVFTHEPKFRIGEVKVVEE